ncbi:MAG: hypothetical protein HYX53_02265 [Chloroflexi bacterium]|nr:hypothetical protein [Chloroflexota bacterium]
MNRVICDAIRERTALAFDYDGGGQRLVEPHCHGYNVNRREVLRGYQVAGVSRTGIGSGWKIFLVERMRSLAATSIPVSSGRDGEADVDADMVLVDCRISIE